MRDTKLDVFFKEPLKTVASKYLKWAGTGLKFRAFAMSRVLLRVEVRGAGVTIPVTRVVNYFA